MPTLRATVLLSAALAALATPAAAMELVLATGASIASGRGEGPRGAHLFALRGLLPDEPGRKRHWDLGFAGHPRFLFDPGSSGFVAASLLARPWRALHAGAGVTVRRGGASAPAPALRPGFELSGGVVLPLGPGAGLDLGARYAHFPPARSAGPAPDRFAERFWTLTAGIALEL